ncbi:MAG TPA: hypothetical protein VMH30_09255 [Verrucomicrobiae bacterium]|nr:hypothetical protein [Verrucomicrobiae bacterium]
MTAFEEHANRFQLSGDALVVTQRWADVENCTKMQTSKAIKAEQLALINCLSRVELQKPASNFTKMQQNVAIRPKECMAFVEKLKEQNEQKDEIVFCILNRTEEIPLGLTCLVTRSAAAALAQTSIHYQPMPSRRSE